MSEQVYLNDGLVAATAARVSVFDTALLHGVGLFETMRAYGGKVFRLEDHLERMLASAAVLKLTITQTHEEIRAAVAMVLEANGLAEARVRVTATPGDMRQLEVVEQAYRSTLIVTASTVQPYPAEYYEKGVMVIVSDYKQNPDDPTAGHKTLNYFPRMAALQAARQQQAGEALWFTTTNRLAEGCISNVFLVKEGVLLTPPLETPVLAGVARKVVLELAKEFGIEAREQECVVADLLGADEVFLTNSIMEVMPVCHIEKHVVGTGAPGEVTKKLLDGYRQDTRKGIEQVDEQ